MVGKIRYTFGWPEVAEILIKKQDIHEGEREWRQLNFQLRAACLDRVRLMRSPE
jgi:hypothetical protein